MGSSRNVQCSERRNHSNPSSITNEACFWLDSMHDEKARNHIRFSSASCVLALLFLPVVAEGATARSRTGNLLRRRASLRLGTRRGIFQMYDATILTPACDCSCCIVQG